MTGGRAFRAAAFCLFLLCLLPSAAGAFKDADARQEIDELRTRIDEIDSLWQVRQMGTGEQFRDLREEIARISGRMEEGERTATELAGRINRMKQEIQDQLSRLRLAQQERLDIIDGSIAQLAQGIEDLQANIRTLSDNQTRMSEFETKQEEKINSIAAQFQKKLQGMVDEVGRENQRLQQSLSLTQQDVAALHKALVQQNERLDAISRAVETLSVSTPAAAGGTHVVQRGETLSTIAARYGVTVEEILQRNALSDPNLIREGQRLLLP